MLSLMNTPQASPGESHVMLPDFSTPVVDFSSYSNAPEQLTSNETWFNSLFSDDIGDDAIASPVASFVVEDSNGNKDIVTGIHQESTLLGKSTLVGASSLDQAQYAAANEQMSGNSSNTSQNVAKSTFRVEADAMNLRMFRTESSPWASDKSVLSLFGSKTQEVGTATFDFAGFDGVYNSQPEANEAALPIQYIEAEDLERSVYRLESSSAASGNLILSLDGKGGDEIGYATTIYTGPEGLFDIHLIYFDESDGVGALEVYHNDDFLKGFTLNEQFKEGRTSSKNRVLGNVAKGLSLEQGDVLQIKGIEHRGEHARIDALVLSPAGSLLGELDDLNQNPGNSNQEKPSQPKSPSQPEANKRPSVSKRPTSVKNSDILLKDDFEDGRISSDWGHIDTPKKSHSLNIVNDPTGQSDKIARFEMRRTDPLASGNFRSEISTPHEPVGSELSYEFSLLLPSNWKTDPTNEIITQWHGAPDRSKGETWESKGGPPLSIHIDGNEMYIKTNWNTGSGKKTAILWRGS